MARRPSKPQSLVVLALIVLGSLGYGAWTLLQVADADTVESLDLAHVEETGAVPGVHVAFQARPDWSQVVRVTRAKGFNDHVLVRSRPGAKAAVLLRLPRKYDRRQTRWRGLLSKGAPRAARQRYQGRLADTVWVLKVGETPEYARQKAWIVIATGLGLGVFGLFGILMYTER
jgi:hypothetical protein